MKNRTESLNAINELSYEIDKQELEGKSVAVGLQQFNLQLLENVEHILQDLLNALPTMYPAARINS